jgi:hypothetical protein
MNGDFCQPGRELCPPGELTQVLISLRVRVLNHISRFAAVLQNGASNAVQARVIPLEELTVKVGFTCNHPFDKFLIA